jgi:hypothetical protein
VSIVPYLLLVIIFPQTPQAQISPGSCTSISYPSFPHPGVSQINMTIIILPPFLMSFELLENTCQNPHQKRLKRF